MNPCTFLFQTKGPSYIKFSCFFIQITKVYLLILTVWVELTGLNKQLSFEAFGVVIKLSPKPLIAVLFTIQTIPIAISKLDFIFKVF